MHEEPYLAEGRDNERFPRRPLPVAAVAAMALAVCLVLIAHGAPAEQAEDAAPAQPPEPVSVWDFRDKATEDDWSPAIQAAIDSVSRANGYVRGATVHLPPGDYPVSRTIVMGDGPAHWGLRLEGYGARLIGTEQLDDYPWHEQKKARLDTFSDNAKTAWEDDEGQGVPILELRNPPDFEGAGFVIEGLTFDRAVRRSGIGIKVAANHVPKGTTFRSVKVFGQDVGFHINYAWQFYFSDCIVRHNRIGLWGQNHFNAISVTNSVFRRNHADGIRVGPDRGQWGSNGIHVAGSIMEDNGGYGFLSRSGIAVVLKGNYFESNGTAVGILGALGHTLIEGNHMTGVHRGHQPDDFTAYRNQAHIVIDRTRAVQVRNNWYRTVEGMRGNILIASRLSREGRRCVFDSKPVVDVDRVRLPDGLTVPSDDGTVMYEYREDERAFVERPVQR